jgi:hypothetical protein
LAKNHAGRQLNIYHCGGEESYHSRRRSGFVEHHALEEKRRQ